MFSVLEYYKNLKQNPPESLFLCYLKDDITHPTCMEGKNENWLQRTTSPQDGPEYYTVTKHDSQCNSTCEGCV